MVMLLRPLLLVDVMLRMPAIPLTASSIGSVICDSMMSALAPTYPQDTVIMGGSTLGNSRMPRDCIPMTPNNTMTTDITMANTGR